MKVKEQGQLLLAGESAAILGLSTERVRQLAAEGKLTVLRTPTGTRLFMRREVETLAASRREQRRESA